MKRIILAFSIIALLSSCSNEGEHIFYPDPFVFEIGTPKDSVICRVEGMISKSQERNPVRAESMKGGALKIYNVYNHENSNRWAMYSLYLFFDGKDQVSDILILDVYDQANASQIDLWNQEHFLHTDFFEGKDGIKKNIAPHWYVSHNDNEEYVMAYTHSRMDAKSLAPCVDYAFAKTHKANAMSKLNQHKLSDKPDFFGIPVNRANDAVGELVP